MTSLFINITKEVELKKDGKGKFNKKHLHLTQVLKKIKEAINTTEKFSFRHD